MLNSVYKLSVAKQRPLTGRSGASATERFELRRKAGRIGIAAEFSTADWLRGRLAAITVAAERYGPIY